MTITSRPIFFIVLFCLNSLSLKSLAFPETATHGYLSCSTCHYSPSGRGLLNPYGKTISNELYSAWKSKNESDSLDSETPWWRVGGQVRLIQLVQDNKTLQKARFFPMQAELEGAIDKELWAGVISMGAWRPMDSKPEALRSYSRNHYVLYRPTENWILRAGHFRVSHGLGLPDHNTFTNQFLGWTHSHETNNLELTYQNESNVLQATWITPSELLTTKETVYGESLTAEQLLFNKHKLGINLTHFFRQKIEEWQANLHGVWSVTGNSFLQAEVAQRNIHLPTPVDQRASFLRYSYQLKYGLRPFFQWETAQQSGGVLIRNERRILGSEWFPTHNVDLLFYAGNEQSNRTTDTLFFIGIGHLYF